MSDDDGVSTWHSEEAMRRFILVRFGALLLALLASFGTTGAAGTPAGPAADLGGITLRSSTIPSGTVTLKNGEYREPAGPGDASSTVVKLTDRRAFGVVQGRDAAAVVIVTDRGGSGAFFDLALLFKGKDGWVTVDTVLLGDRVQVHSVDIRDNEVFVSMTSHGPGEPLCCPTHKKTVRFAVQADHLIAQHEEKKTAIGGHEIAGPVWRWVRTRYGDDTTLLHPDAAAGYTLHLKPDGTVQVRGDCNLGGGSYTLKDANLAITITHVTRAACPEGSLEDAFIRDIGRTGGFLLKNGRLFLDLQLDSGTMEFRE